MDIIPNLSTAVTLVKRLQKISKNIENAEFKNALAELMNELADAKLDAASLKENMATLMGENQSLQQQIETITISKSSPPTGMKNGLYIWENEEIDKDSLFCTACWESKYAKSRVTRLKRGGLGIIWECPVCKSGYGASY